MKNTLFEMVEFSNLQKLLHPLMQGTICLGIGVGGILFSKIIGAASFYSFLFAFVGIIFFTLLNNIISVFNESFIKYTWPSWGIFILLTIILLLVARFVSGESIQKHAEFIKILISVSVFYLVLSGIMRIIRAMWEFAEADEN